jgi:SAM-dependent methyltransferase
MLSLGGALGGLAVGIGAVKLFNANYEFIMGLVMTMLVLVVLLRRQWKILLILFVLELGFGAYFAYTNRDQMSDGIVLKKRNFYGSLSVREVGLPDDAQAIRRLIHGVIIHGEQYRDERWQDEPTTYYRVDSGVGRALETIEQANRRIGVIGLGTGTLAVYGRPGDVMRFYDINPQVIEVAQSHFTFLKRSKAQIDLVLGDARLAMEQEAPQSYDSLVVDAFSSDSIPAHLATTQAVDVYLRHLKPKGIIAFHISNKFLKLAPVLKQIAEEKKMRGMLVTEPADGREHYSSEWFLMTKDAHLEAHPAIAPQIASIEKIENLQLWTDDFNNLFQILK